MYLTRAEVAALMTYFAQSFVDANANPILHALIRRLDAWLEEQAA